MKRTNIVFSVLSMILGGVVLFLTRSWPESSNGIPGPAVFPRIIAAIIIACGLAILIRTLLSRNGDEDTAVDYTSKDVRGVYITMAALVLYFILMKYLGFIIDTVIMLTCFFAWFSKKKIYICILMAAVSSLLIYTVFSKALNVSLRFGLLYF